MTILVGSDVPGLLSALEQALGGSQQLTVLHDGDAIWAYLTDPSKRIDALILSDAISPPANTDVATALWNITSYVARSRQPKIPTVLTLHHDTPPEIYTALQAEVRRTGGDALLVPQSIRNPNQEEAQQTVAWINAHLALEQQRRCYTILGISDTGGVGITSTMINMSLQFVRLGLRVLIVDCEDSRNSLNTWLRVKDASHAPREALLERDFVQRVVHHQFGVDVLFVPYHLHQDHDVSSAKLDVLLDQLKPLHYDIICVDGLQHWQTRADVLALLTQPSTSALVVCPAGAKERAAAVTTLDALGTVKREDGRTALDVAMLLFLEAERGQLLKIEQVKRDVLQRYPNVTALGTLPRDSALLSMVAEHQEFTTVFDLAPKRQYCHGIRRAVRRWAQAVELPATWLIRPDPYEHPPRKRFWALRRLSKAKSPKASQHLPAFRKREQDSMPQLELYELGSEPRNEIQPKDNQPQAQESSIVTMALQGVTTEVEAQQPVVDQLIHTPALVEDSTQTLQAEAATQLPINTSWLDTARQHQRARVLRVSVPEQQDQP